ncbi:hypothetical protein ACN38_g9449 [Penicillium nordicum]|uniref:Uncharacterized protein n=1 Tax=Penicillium nordicum TaxID=229535 RepID=A0A0M9WCJ7_9EURO|nr:hypothetical protein ACN38_g9449 [Penicillium nordicum]
MENSPSFGQPSNSERLAEYARMLPNYQKGYSAIKKRREVSTKTERGRSRVPGIIRYICTLSSPSPVCPSTLLHENLHVLFLPSESLLK